MSSNDQALYGTFAGDGRNRVQPNQIHRDLHPKWQSVPITKAAARKLIDQFTATGLSVHSEAANTIWVIDMWCRHAKVDYKIIHHPMGGWAIKFIPSDEEPDDAALASVS